jgi:hypothetical protein
MLSRNIVYTALILSILMIGCGRSTSKHPLSGEDFPTTCLDSEIGGQIETKGTYYPIYIDYSPENFETISKKYCNGLFPPNRVFRRDVNKESVEVTFFITLERANIFREVISSRFPSAEVGKSITLQSVKDPENIDEAYHFMKYKIPSTYFPKIPKDDLENLKQIVNKDSLFVKNFQVALPTYIPDKFKLENVEVQRSETSIGYSVTYVSNLGENSSESVQNFV